MKKKVIKVIIYLLLAIFLLGASVFAYCSFEGYQMYQEALKEKSIEDRISEIRSDEDYVTIDNLHKDNLNMSIHILKPQRAVLLAIRHGWNLKPCGSV